MARYLTFDQTVRVVAKRRGAFVAPTSLLDEGGSDAGPSRRVNVDAFVPADRFLRRQIRAPLSARRSITSVARLDLIRQTPFTEENVYWTLGPVTQSNGELRAEQWVVRKSDVAMWRDNLRSANLTLRRLHVAGAKQTKALVDFSSDLAPMASVWRRINAGLATASVLCAGLVWLYPGWVASQQFATLEQERSALRDQALALRQEIDVLRQQETERAAFLDAVFKRPLVAHTMRELTVALPDTVWTETLVFRSNRVVLSGQTSGSAADIVLELAGNRRFGNPRLSGPVSRTADGSERFELTIDLGGDT